MLPVGILVYEKESILLVNTKFKDLFQNQGESEEATIINFREELKQHTADDTRLYHKGRTLLVLYKLLGDFTIYSITDITDINNLSIKESQDKFKEKLMMSFAHEFRTPLNWLAGTITSLDITGTNKDAIRMAVHAIDLLDFYINDMIYFNLSKGEEVLNTNIDHIRISESIKESIEFLDLDIKCNNAKCLIYIDNNVPTYIKGNPTRFKQIIINIVSNCIKSVQSLHGKITVSTEVKSSLLYTTITDNGKKLDENELSILLDLYNCMGHENNLQVRFGLGMILCRSMCQKCKGDLSISSDPSGTKYIFWIPATILSQTEIERLKRRSSGTSMLLKQSPSSSSKIPKEEIKQVEIIASNIPDAPIMPEKVNDPSKILTDLNKDKANYIDFFRTIKQIESSGNASAPIALLVDDTPFNNVVLKRLLEKFKIDVCCCVNGLEAVEQVKMRVFSMIFMDINMPVMDGIVATRQIKAYLKCKEMYDIPIIGLSAQDDSKIVEEAISAGMDEYGICISSYQTSVHIKT